MDPKSSFLIGFDWAIIVGAVLGVLILDGTLEHDAKLVHAWVRARVRKARRR